MNGQGGRNGPGVVAFSSQNGGQYGIHKAGQQERRRARPFPHIKDLNLKASALQVDRNTPITRLLQLAQESLEFSKSSVEFKRPEVAYVEYLKAFDVLVNIVPMHKDYGAFNDRGDWARMYRSLMKSINAQQSMIDQIKLMILEDNSRSGIQPTQPTLIQPPENRPSSRPSSSASASNGIPTPSSTPPPSSSPYPRSSLERSPRQRPAPRPKPEALHGHLVNSNGAIQQDQLAERFARLRFPQSPNLLGATNADSNPIRMPSPSDFAAGGQLVGGTASMKESVGGSTLGSRPSGPREMPMRLNMNAPPHPPKIPLGEVSLLPRAPSPAYSPVTSFSNQPSYNPSKTSSDVVNAGNVRNSFQISQSPRDSITRTESPMRKGAVQNGYQFAQSGGSNGISNGVPVNANRQSTGSQPLQDYNVYSSSTTTSISSARSSIRKTINLPSDRAISAEMLFDYIKQYHVLLIDVRSRDQFDQGHIFSKSVICIEPFSLRPGLSADELEDSLVVSPESEQNLFGQRHEFDLVVFYDQSTTGAQFLTPTLADTKAPGLRFLFDTLYEFNYEKQLKDGRHPVLLSGGVDAWTDLVGPQSLQSSRTAAGVGLTRQPVRRQLKSVGRRPTVNANSSIEIRRRRLQSHRHMTASEEKEWQQKVKEEEIDPSRYKPSSEDEMDPQDGMDVDQTAPVTPMAHTYEEFFRRFPDPSTIQESMIMPTAPPPPIPMKYGVQADLMPQVPTRPPPSVPRPSYHGTVDTTATQTSLSRQTSAQAPPLYFPFSQQRRRLPLAGLKNYGVTCYLSATVQCLNATMPLTTHFLSDKWRRYLQKNNRGSSGNLLPQVYANLIHNMWATNPFESIGPLTFRQFWARSNTEISEDRQHDAKEFLDLVLDYLHSDMNVNHNRTILQNLTAEQEAKREQMPVSEVSYIEWGRYIHREFSIISTLFAGQHLSRLRCLTCSSTSTTYETFYSISVEIPHGAAHTDINACLASYFKEEVLAEDQCWRCPTCKCERRATKKLTLTRIPQYLIIHFKRFIKGRRGSQKLHTEIDFPLYGLSMDPYMINRPLPSHTPDMIGSLLPNAQYERADPAVTPPFSYNAYGVVRHQGARTDSGHYVACVKDSSRGSWFKFDDERVTELDIERLSSRQRLQNHEAYIVFYERAAPK